MSTESTKKKEPGRAERIYGALQTVAVVLVCLALYFLFDGMAGWLYDILPDGLQKLLIFVGALLLLFGWLGRVFDWVERDLERIQKEERAAKARDLKSQTNQANVSGNDGSKL